ncbi:MAG: GNAT family N-acetyltransferase [Rhodocyclaceae bacterium]|nr:GNAT family N-acetyltransferase [Rhodocyclaceae bacterium]
MKTKIFKRISEVPSAAWNALQSGHSLAFSSAFWEVIEQSRMNDFEYRHLLITDDHEQPLALTSYYSITTDIAIFAPLPLRKILGKIRKFFPGFLKFRMLEWGTPITVSSPPFIVAPGVSLELIIKEIHRSLLLTAKTEGHLFIISRDFESNSQVLQKKFSELGYHLVDSLPNTYLDIIWTSIGEYHASMKSYYRSKLFKHLRRNQQQDVHHELVDNFDHLAEQLCEQWMVVHEQADEFQREVLTPSFYREFSQRMGAHSKALLFYRKDQLVGHALLLQDGQLLRWLYFGRNDATNDSLYLYVAHAVIEAAIQTGASRLEMGLTTYAIKQDLGAQPEPICIALRASRNWLNPFISRVYTLLNNPANLNSRNVFKNRTTTEHQ